LFSFETNNTLIIAVPANARSGDIVVTNACGTATFKGFVFTGGLPVIQDFFPKSGCAGEEIILTGKNFGGPPANPAIWTHPLNPGAEDTVTIYFDASKGNRGLKDCNCTVYLHTGLITAASKGPGDWKNIKTKWGVSDPQWAMTPVKGRPNLYKYTFTSGIRNFYGATRADSILQMAFVFRDGNGIREGKDAGEKDFFIRVSFDSGNLNLQRSPQLTIGKKQAEIIFNSGDTIIAIVPEIPDSGAVEIKTYCGSFSHKRFYALQPYLGILNAGVDLEICNAPSVEVKLNGSITNPIILPAWRLIPGRGDSANISSFSDPKAILRSMRPASDGYLLLVWGVEKGCVAQNSNKTDTLAIRLFPPPGPAKILSPISASICNSTTLDLKAQPVFVGTGRWEILFGPGRIDASTLPGTRVTGLIPGQNTRIRWTIGNGVCPVISDEITLINAVANPPAEAGPEQTVCVGTPTLRMNASLRPGQFGRWSTVQGFGTARFSSTSDPRTEIFEMSPNADGILLLKWEVFGGGCFLRENDNIDLVRINFDFPQRASILSRDTVLCSGSDYEIRAGSNFTGIGKWILLIGRGNILHQDAINTSITGLSAGKVQVAWSIKNGQCPESFDTLNIQVDEKPVAVAGAPQMLCAQKDALLNAQPPVVGIGNWQKKQGSGLIENPSLPNSRISNLPDSGKVELIWTVKNGACPAASAETYLLNYMEPFPPNAGKDTMLCDSRTFQLAAEPPKVGIGQWTISSGPGKIQNTSDPRSLVTDFIGGSMGVFRWTVRNGVCPEKSDEVSIKVDLLPSVANAGKDTALCGLDNYLLEASNPVIGKGSWRILSGNIRLDNPVLPNARLQGLQQGTTARLVWEVENGVCSVSRDTVVITSLNVGPVVTPRFLIRDTFCVSESVKVIEISSSSDSIFAQNTSFYWDFGDGNTSIARDPTHRYINPGIYLIKLKVNTGFCRSFEISKTVFVRPAPCATPGDFVNKGKPANPFVSLSSFPNPTSGTFKVEATLSYPTAVLVRIISAEGRLLETRERIGVISLNEAFDLPYSGFFIVEVVSGTVSRHFRMMGIRP
jgi:hypothetical protein